MPFQSKSTKIGEICSQAQKDIITYYILQGNWNIVLVVLSCKIGLNA
jgi:hypothetical protein